MVGRRNLAQPRSNDQWKSYLEVTPLNFLLGDTNKICLQDRRCVPGQWICGAAFCSSSWSSFYCGSSESFEAMELWLIWGLWLLLWMAVAGRRRCNPACKGSRVLVVFFLFSKGLCANSLVVELSSVFYQNVLCVCWSLWYFHG